MNGKINISIIDSIMGSGKSTWALDKMKNKKPEDKYIIVTPYLTEIERFCNELVEFEQPRQLGEGKLENFHDLLVDEKNIIASHALFRMCNDESMELIRDGGYKIIIDETLDVFDIFDMSIRDFEMLINSKVIKLTENGIIKWLDLEYDGEFNDFKTLCQNGQVYKVKETQKRILLVWTLNIEMFYAFEEIIILTYIYEAQLMYYYFKLNGIEEYNKYTIDNHELVDYFYQSPNIKDKINIYEGSMNLIGEKPTALSLNWFKNNKSLTEKLQKHILNYFRTTLNVKTDELIWTTFKSCKNKLKGKGYTNGFISLNTRATNEYVDRRAIAYCCNRFISPDYTNFLYKKGITFNDDAYALSELVQFIWRSRIRKGESIDIYIPSNRMKNILKDWINS